jgi:CRP/FNR family transcriptional regulator, cyclic AMP receptor protein
MNLTYMQHGMPIDTQPDIQHGEPAGTMHMMGDLVIPDERILHALHNSGLVENLRDFEVNILASLITIQYFEVREIVAEPGYDTLKDSLMILVEGEIEVSAFVENEPVSLHLAVPGDMARIISFVGGDMMQVSSRIKVKKGSAVLLLQRSRLETLLFSHPSIVYCVMRNLVRHVHGVARRKNAEKEEMSNYLYSIHGRY